MALRDDILTELETAALLTHPDWGAVADEIMKLVLKAAKKGEIPGKDTLGLALENWKKGRWARQYRYQRPEDFIVVEPLPEKTPLIFDKKPPKLFDEEE